MGAAFPHPVRAAIYAVPDPRLEPCEQCRANGWVPEILDLGEDFGGRPLIARNVCSACHGEGWVLKA